MIFLLWLLGALPLCAQKLSPLEKAPDWSELDRYQETISREDFLRRLETVFAPRETWHSTIEVNEKSARIRQTLTPPVDYLLRFGDRPLPERSWRLPSEITRRASDPPLRGVRIAIDPGHLGGDWARMEERWFQIGEAPPVTEGDMTLRVARKLAAKLQEQGAEVTLVRSSANPVTPLRPADLETVARTDLGDRGVTAITRGYAGPTDPKRFSSIQWQSEVLFYRAAEIRARGALVNQTIRPDLTVCLHFNAEAWGDPAAPSLTEQNHLHFLINGSYSAAELEFDDIRFDMLKQLLRRTALPSLMASEAVARAMSQATGLPPYHYAGANAFPVGATGYVWARNLLANRLYQCPVIYAEPYVMNSRVVFERVRAGDYPGRKMVGGESRSSIFEEYAEGMYRGILRYFAGPGSW